MAKNSTNAILSASLSVMRKLIILKVVPLLLLTVFVFYLPLILKPDLLLNRGNDLQEQFWPVFYYIKHSLLTTNQLPLWNTMFFAGMPILPDPQFSLFYLPNWFMVLLPINVGFFTYFMFHSLLAGINSFLLGYKGLKLSKWTSTLVAMIYLTTPRVTAYIESGHYGLVAAHSWLPLVFLSVIYLAKEAKFKYTIPLAISLAGLFYSHTVIATLTLPLSGILLLLTSIFILKRQTITKKLFLFLLGVAMTFCITAPTLLPQIEWIPNTTRSLLLGNPDVYPKWSSYKEFSAALLPLTNINSIDSEKLITLGMGTFIFATIGFFYLSKRLKLFTAIFAIGSLGVILNNISPLYSTLLFEDWYALMRVTTRFWFVFGTIVIFTAGVGINRLFAKNSKLIKTFTLALVFIALFENFNVLTIKLTSNQRSTPQFVSDNVYSSILSPKEKFRVLCTTRCISQKQAALKNLELIEGYNTFQQLNYYNVAQKLMGANWTSYTLAFPPVDITTISPDPKTLGQFNTKYVISPYKLTDKNFDLKTQEDNFFIYENKLFMSRAYTSTKLGYTEAPVMLHTPNHIRIDTSTQTDKQLVLAEVYSPGWVAYLNGVEEVSIQETDNALRSVEIKSDTKFVDFKYLPVSFVLGVKITVVFLGVSLVVAIIGVFIKRQKKL